MSDRELLELAAKAAGIAAFSFVEHVKDYDAPHYGAQALQVGSSSYETWNPIINDGDALRLAVKLCIRLNREINCGCDIVEAIGPEDDNMGCHCSTESIEGDPYAATRRAIVRAAAEIGRQMKEGGAK